MDWKIFFTSFWMIFVTEMGDKTQLTNLSLTAESKQPLIVFTASVLGYAAATLLAIVFGGVLFKYVPQHYIQIASGSLFVVIGILILFGIL
ncbi:MAG: TMEM165/GDT1 family protein [Elusimicrobiota bacterium]